MQMTKSSKKSQSVKSQRMLRAKARGNKSLHLERLENRTLLATVAWDGGPTGTGTNWHQPTNWAGDMLPSTEDEVEIGLDFADTTITVSQSVTIAKLSTAGSLELASGTFTVAGQSI